MAIRAGIDPRYRFQLLGDFAANRGNVVFLVDGPDDFGPPRVLKLYRRRRAPLQEWSSTLTQRLLERKSGASARARWETERELLRTWRAAGFDVPAWIDDEPPEGFGELCLWMEYCPGEPLTAWLRDPERREAAEAHLALAAAEIGRRHALGLDEGDLRLFPEHPTFNHVLVVGAEDAASPSAARRVTIDHEARWLASADPEDALATEVAGLLRSLWRAASVGAGDAATTGAAEARLDLWIDRFAHGAAGEPGYGADELLRRAARRVVEGRGLASRARRARDQRRRGARGKTWTMRRLLERL